LFAATKPGPTSTKSRSPPAYHVAVGETRLTINKASNLVQSLRQFQKTVNFDAAPQVLSGLQLSGSTSAHISFPLACCAGGQRLRDRRACKRYGAKLTADRITFQALDASITAIASDEASAAGGNPTISCFDELWGYTSERSRRLWDEMITSPSAAPWGCAGLQSRQATRSQRQRAPQVVIEQRQSLPANGRAASSELRSRRRASERRERG
jgi:hypothetical protein